MPLRIGIVDDSYVFRAGLRWLLSQEADLPVVGEASSARSATALIEESHPDVCIIDFCLPDREGGALIGELLERWPALRMLVLSGETAEFALKRALSMGAKGYAFKAQPPSEIVEAIRRVGSGRVYLPGGMAADKLLGHPLVGRRSADGDPLRDLSTREREVFALAVRGAGNKDIARKLSVSIKTVETHRAHINKKLGVHSPGELIRLAASLGVIGGLRIGDAAAAQADGGLAHFAPTVGHAAV